MKVLVNDQLIEYFDEGSGKVILFLHGWGASQKSFDSLSKPLSKKFRVIGFDFPGFGSSPKPDDNWTVDDYAKITRDFLEKIKIKSVYAVIAHSFGGRVVIKGVNKKYLSPQKVILIGAAGIKPPTTIKKTGYKILAKIGNAVLSLPVLSNFKSDFRKRFYNKIGSEDYLQADQMKKIFLNTINEDLTSIISSIKQPTLLIWGENDQETPITDAKKMNQFIKNSQLEIIPDAGHFVFLDATEKTLEYIKEFL